MLVEPFGWHLRPAAFRHGGIARENGGLPWKSGAALCNHSFDLPPRRASACRPGRAPGSPSIIGVASIYASRDLAAARSGRLNPLTHSGSCRCPLRVVRHRGAGPGGEGVSTTDDREEGESGRTSTCVAGRGGPEGPVRPRMPFRCEGFRPRRPGLVALRGGGRRSAGGLSRGWVAAGRFPRATARRAPVGDGRAPAVLPKYRGEPRCSAAWGWNAALPGPIVA